MANFARIEDGVVTQVIVVGNADILDTEGNESEALGQQFIGTLGLDGNWLQTSYNGNPIAGADRGGFAGIGYTWDGTKFINPLAVADPLTES